MKTLTSRLALVGMVGSLALGSGMVWAAPAAAKPVAKVAAKAAVAKPVSATAVVTAPDASTDKSARVMVLDKQTNRRLVLVLVAGEAQTVGTMQLKLTKCLPDYGAQLGQDVAWLDITEGANGNGRAAPWFSGWMFNTYPEISTLDHPRYDVQLQGCGVKAREVIKATGSAPIIDSTPPADTETPDDEPANSEGNTTSDPYYVPGVEKKAAPAVVDTPPVAIEHDQPADTETPPDNAPITDEVTPPAAPIAGPVPATAPAQQDDLHKMMDSGTY